MPAAVAASVPQEPTPLTPEERRAQQAVMDAKRDANIAARAEHQAVKMNWVANAPVFYQKALAAARADRTVLTMDEKAQRNDLEARRTFRIAARNIFRLADVDGSKALQFSELERLDADNAAELLAVLDADRSGEVTMEEWLPFATMVYEARGPEIAYAMLEGALTALFERALQDEADALFKLFDRDMSGTLDYGEVSAMFPTAPAATSSGRRGGVLDDQAANFLQFVDVDRSGSLDLDEWRGFILTGWRHNPPATRNFLIYLRQAAYEHGFSK